MTDTSMELELSLKYSELRYRRLFEAAQDGILILDAGTGAITDVNPFLVKMLGYSREEFVEKKLWEMGAFKDIEASRKAFEALQDNKYIRYEDLPLRAKSGRLIPVEFVSNVYQAGSDKVIQCNIRDITERKQAENSLVKREELLARQSVRNHLTGLFNQPYMEETLERELLRASRKHLSLGIIMLDMDNFKRYNDTLRALGGLLLGHVRRDDVASHYGDDEFILILPDTSRIVTYRRAEIICEDIKNFHRQFNGQILEPVTCSLGVAVFPENGTTNTEILRTVAEALNRARHTGRGQVVVAD